MKRISSVLVIALTVFVLGCAPEKYAPGSPGDPSLPKDPAKSSTDDPASKKKTRIDVGDIETTVFIEVSLDEATKPANAKVETIQGLKNHMGMVTATIPAPVPPELQLNFRILAEKAFPETSYVIRAKIFRDQDVVGEFVAMVPPPPEGSQAPPQPFDHKMNILAGLSATPDTMLIRTQAEIAVLPQGVDPNSVDLKTVQNASGPNGTLLSNPVRLNFEQNSIQPQS